VFGEDRSQEGQTDMECFDDLLSRLQLQPDHNLLDLGCGAGGQLCILIEPRLKGEGDVSYLDSENTRVAKSLSNLNLRYDTVDYSELFLKFWPRVKETALSLRDVYVSEGSELICDNWIREANEDFLPSVEAGLIKRYLYQIHVD